MTIHESDLNNASYSATYCPEDNKLRLYTGRVERSTYLHLVEAGYTSTPKQNCSFVATWSCAAEDAALALISEDDDIGDESQSPEERAADRAERFSMYRDKRRAEATGLADRFDDGPEVHGYQSQAKAERMAARHGRLRTGALSQWAKAEYWQTRTQGVIAHELYRSSPEVRRGRILKLEAEVRAIESLYTPTEPRHEIIDGDRGLCVWCGKGRGGHWVQVNRLEAIKASYTRALEHLAHRLTYERAMLANEGGTAGDVEMEIGGFIGRHQIHGINKSPVTGAVVSVKLMAPKPWWNGPGEAPLTLQSFNIQRLPEGAYRAPTDEEREQFHAAKKAAKAAKPKTIKPALINPTDEDAQRLQDIWNERARAKRGGRDVEPSEVCRLTQAQYSALSKGDYGVCKTAGIVETGERFYVDSSRHANGTECFKVRYRNRGDFYAAERVVILTDKPQKPLPWEAMQAIEDAKPDPVEVMPKLAEAIRGARWFSDIGPEHKENFDHMYQAGYVFHMSESQFGLTDKGYALLKELAGAQ